MDDQYLTLGDLADEVEATTGERPTRPAELIDFYVDRGFEQIHHYDAFREQEITSSRIRDLNLADISAVHVNDLAHPELAQLIDDANNIDKQLQLGKYAPASDFPEDPEEPEQS